MIHTIGYEGATVLDLVTTLKEAGVQVLVDVRELPLSRRPGFSKRPLSAAVNAAGIEYQHWRALGTPRDIRHAKQATHDLEAFRRAYLAQLDWQTGELEALSRLAGERRICLLCFEADYRECHRSMITERMQSLGLLDEAVHLDPRGRAASGDREGLTP